MSNQSIFSSPTKITTFTAAPTGPAPVQSASAPAPAPAPSTQPAPAAPITQPAPAPSAQPTPAAPSAQPTPTSATPVGPVQLNPTPINTTGHVKQRGGKGTSIAAGTRKKNSPPKTTEDVKFIIDNYASMATREIAEVRGLTEQQVNRTVYDTRKFIATAIESETDPAEAEKKQAWLDAKFPSKADNFGRKRGSTIATVLNDLDFSL